MGRSRTVKKPAKPAKKPDRVRQPPHYVRLKPEPIEIIDSWRLGFYPAQVLKYIARAGHKDDMVEDLKKASWYLNRWIIKLIKEGK